MVQFEGLGTAVARIRDRSLWISTRAFSVSFQCGPIKGAIIGFANEIFGGDHKALAVERQVQQGAKFGFGMPLALLNGSSIEIIKGDQAIRNMALAFKVDYQATLPLAQPWGGGDVASADGLRFVTPVRTLNAGPNRKYFGSDWGLTYYNFTSDQYTGFHGSPHRPSLICQHFSGQTIKLLFGSPHRPSGSGCH